MPRYIDADALTEQMKNACMGVMSGCDPFNEPLKVLESAPTVDVVEVVRCKDCKHWKTVGACVAKFCTRIVNTEIMKYEDDYCSLGERREE